jgi:hypothetical protein
VVKVSIEVHQGAVRFKVAVRAESIERALSLAQRLYPGGDCRVKFPIDPEGFFVKHCAASAGLIGFELTEQMAV